MVKVAKIPRANAGEDLFRFHCKAAGMPKPVEQFLFAEALGKRYRADFCWPDYKLIVEINGGIFMKRGAHAMPTKIVSDMVRQQHATLLGYYMLAFTPDDVTSGHAIEWTRKTLEALRSNARGFVP